MSKRKALKERFCDWVLNSYENITQSEREDIMGKVIRRCGEIIPFPMNKNAMDIMMGAPGTVEQKQLDELHLAITAKPED